MSQSGYTPIQLYRTTTASATPTAGNLAAGELAINTTDEKLYFKNAGGTVKLLASNVTPVANGGTGATTADDARTNLSAQVTLVSGTNIKTINSTTLLGSGDVAVQPTLVSGSNIKTVNGTTLLGSGDLGTIAIGYGGTGATTASGARTALGLAIGTDVPAYASTTLKTSSTGSAAVPSGTTGERDGSPSAGYFRFNSTLSKFEGYNGSAWGAVGGGATGGGSDAIFIENGQTVTVDYTITSGNNAGTFGPVSIASGVTVTVPSGSVWTIV